MPRFERLTEVGIERILAEGARRRVFRHYLKLAELRAQEKGRSVLEVIESDFGHETGGYPRRLFAPMRPPEESALNPETITIVYSFSTPYGGDLIYYPQRRTAISPLLPKGVRVQLSPLEGLLLETFMRGSTAVHTTAELFSLIRENLSQAPVPDESNRVGVIIYRLREKLGDAALNNKGKFPIFRLIHTTPMGYTLVPNPVNPSR